MTVFQHNLVIQYQNATILDFIAARMTEAVATTGAITLTCAKKA